MKTIAAITLLALTSFGCAGAQTKIDHVQSQINCYFDLVQPYAELLTEEQLKELTKDLDVISVLEYAGVAKEEIEKVKAGIEVCKAL